MTRDRTYFRMLSDTALAEAARYCDNDLAIVLGERLHDLIGVEDQIEALKNEVVELNARCDLWKAEAAQLQRQTNIIDIT